MIMAKWGDDKCVRQCVQVRDEYPELQESCDNPQKCVRGGWPHFDKYGFNLSPPTNDKALTFEEIKQEVGVRGRPFACSWHYEGGMGHMLVVIGYETVDAVDRVILLDPLPEPGEKEGEEISIPWDEFDAGTYRGKKYHHWKDYFGIVPK